MVREVSLVFGLLVANLVCAQDSFFAEPGPSSQIASDVDAANSFPVAVEVVELNDVLALFAYRHDSGILTAADARQLRELAEVGDVEYATFTLTLQQGLSARLLPGRWEDDFSMLTVDAFGDRTRVTVSHCLDDELPSRHEYLIDEGESLLLPRMFEYDDCVYLTTLSLATLPAEAETLSSADEQVALPVIHGIVRDESGEPLAGVTVSVHDHDLYRFFSPGTVTDQNGEYRFEVESGFGFSNWFACLHLVHVRVEHPTLVSTESEYDRTWLPAIPGAVVHKNIVLVPAEAE